MSSRWRVVLLALLLLGARPVSAADPDPLPDAERKAPAPTDPGVRRRFSSDKSKTRDDAEDESGPKVGSPHGPAMDGVRGSGIAPAPGAFGTDAGSPSDLRR